MNHTRAIVVGAIVAVTGVTAMVFGSDNTFNQVIGSVNLFLGGMLVGSGWIARIIRL